MKLHGMYCEITGVSGQVYRTIIKSETKMTEQQCCDYILSKKTIDVNQYLSEAVIEKKVVTRNIEAIKLKTTI